MCRKVGAVTRSRHSTLEAKDIGRVLFSMGDWGGGEYPANTSHAKKNSPRPACNNNAAGAESGGGPAVEVEAAGGGILRKKVY